MSKIQLLKDKIIFRITRINPTITAKNNNLITVDANKLKKISKFLTSKGWNNHIYMTEFNDNLNCGQLIYDYNKKN